jgi:hypothetical protein
MKTISSLCVLVVLFSACENNNDTSYRAVTNDPLLYSRTVKNLNDIVLENNFAPMVASRNYVYANIAAYECVAAGDSTYPSLAGQIRHLPALPKPQGTDIDFSLAAMLALVKVGNAVTFPEGSMMSHYERLVNMADSVGMPRKTLRNTKVFADSIASAILAWSKRDNYARKMDPYTSHVCNRTRTSLEANSSDDDGFSRPVHAAKASGFQHRQQGGRLLPCDDGS